MKNKLISSFDSLCQIFGNPGGLSHNEMNVLIIIFYFLLIIICFTLIIIICFIFWKITCILICSQFSVANKISILQSFIYWSNKKQIDFTSSLRSKLLFLLYLCTFECRTIQNFEFEPINYILINKLLLLRKCLINNAPYH